MSLFSTYKSILSHCKIPINCHFCDNEFLPKTYSHHLREYHADCVPKQPFCAACVNFTWKKGDKQINNYEHRVPCWQNKIQETINYRNKIEKDKQLLGSLGLLPYIKQEKIDLLYACTECDGWYNEIQNTSQAVDRHILNNISQYAYEDVPCDITKWLNDDDGEYLQLDPICGIDGNWMRVYHLLNDHKYRWYHYSIRLADWDKFYLYAMEMQELCGVMPYWCLSSGVKYDNYTVHFRHVILFTKQPEYINEILLKLKKENEPRRGVAGAYYVKEILSSKQFMNTWNNISAKKSCADFRVGKFHYYQSRPIGPHSLFWMSLYSPNGLQEVTEILKGNFDVTNYASVEKLADGRYTIKYRYIWHDLLNHILPLSRELEPNFNNNPFSKCCMFITETGRISLQSNEMIKEDETNHYIQEYNELQVSRKFTLGDLMDNNKLFLLNDQQQQIVKAVDCAVIAYRLENETLRKELEQVKIVEKTCLTQIEDLNKIIEMIQET